MCTALKINNLTRIYSEYFLNCLKVDNKFFTGENTSFSIVNILSGLLQTEGKQKPKLCSAFLNTHGPFVLWLRTTESNSTHSNSTVLVPERGTSQTRTEGFAEQQGLQKAP